MVPLLDNIRANMKTFHVFFPQNSFGLRIPTLTVFSSDKQNCICGEKGAILIKTTSLQLLSTVVDVLSLSLLLLGNPLHKLEQTHSWFFYDSYSPMTSIALKCCRSTLKSWMPSNQMVSSPIRLQSAPRRTLNPTLVPLHQPLGVTSQCSHSAIPKPRSMGRVVSDIKTYAKSIRGTW